MIVEIVQHFQWRWVAFLNVDDDYGNDGLNLFLSRINGSDICLGYTKALNYATNYSQTLREIELQNIKVVIIFAAEWTAEKVMEAAIQQNASQKVWIAGDAWALNEKLRRKRGIQDIGTVLGVAEPRSSTSIPGFTDFLHSASSQTGCEPEEQSFCNQVCNCSHLSAQQLITGDPSFSFPVYSAVYAVAHALHHSLRCGQDSCGSTAGPRTVRGQTGR